MAVIAPFRGLTYNVSRLGEISRLVAPPYDVISVEEQEQYYQTDPYNVIRLILGKTKTGDSDWDNRYTRAADFFQRWESEDVFVRDEFVGITYPVTVIVFPPVRTPVTSSVNEIFPS